MSTNEAAARMLDEYAEIHGALGDSRRRLAYERAAASLRSAGVRLSPATTEAELDALPNVGVSIAEKVREFLQTGTVQDLEDLRKREFPRDFHAFVQVNGVGPKIARRLYRELRIDTLDDLERAAKAGLLRDSLGMSPALVQRILREIPRIREGGGAERRVLLAEALPQAEALVETLRGVPGVREVEVAGSIRRRKATIGDIDLIAAVDDKEVAIEAFATLPDVREVLVRGEHTRVLLRSGLEADLWVVTPSGWGAALSYATGSREHTLELRMRAQERGWSIRTEEVVDEGGTSVLVATEEEFYRVLGLEWVAPELRENRGELKAAEAGTLPRLVTLEDLRGDLHMHTRASDGVATLEAMVAAAQAMGREYVAITDHAHGLPVPRGLDEDAFLARKAALQEADLPLPVLVGAEVNILEDGSLSLEDRALEALDVVVASVHSGLREPRAKITKRVTDALSTGLVDVLGHPTNRRMPRRAESDIDFERVFEVAAAQRVALEINGSPERMDLPGTLVKRAKEHGLRFTIDSDAHAPGELANLEYGVAMARRGWLEAEDVLTTRPFDELTRWLDGRR